LLSFAFLSLVAASCEGEPSSEKKPVVIMETSMGTIKIELDAEKAPITVKNFLSYVDDKFYDGTIFHRVIEDFMIQGGGFQQDGYKEKKTKAGIKNESKNGLSNVRGSIAMARTNDPDSATGQFFINSVDNSRKLDAAALRGVGYAVFGKVIEGQDVVDKIRAVKTGVRELTTPQGKGPFEDVPLEDVVIKSVRRAEK